MKSRMPSSSSSSRYYHIHGSSSPSSSSSCLLFAHKNIVVAAAATLFIVLLSAASPTLAFSSSFVAKQSSPFSPLHRKPFSFRLFSNPTTTAITPTTTVAAILEDFPTTPDNDYGDKGRLVLALSDTKGEEEINRSPRSSSSSSNTIRLATTIVHHRHDKSIITCSPKQEEESVLLPRPKEDSDQQQQQQQNVVVDSDDVVALTPLSPNPLLFASTAPLLTSQECQTLSEWCRRVPESSELSLAELLAHPDYEHQEGTRLLKQLQRTIHHSVLGHDEDDDTDYVVPRFLHYRQQAGNAAGHVEKKNAEGNPSPLSLDQLVPDGLHLDTNNNKHFRHWTILVYLDSPPTAASGGATTFPLAERYNDKDDIIGSDTQQDQHGRLLSKACKAARELALDENIHHTRISTDERHLQLGRTIEQAAFDLYQAEMTPGPITGSPTTKAPAASTPAVLDRGIRVVPRQGHMCLFSGLQHDGYPNPLSYHAGEAVLADGATKNVLTFFYEIPLTPQISDRAAFGEQVRRREQAFLDFHGVTYK